MPALSQPAVKKVYRALSSCEPRYLHDGITWFAFTQPGRRSFSDLKKLETIKSIDVNLASEFHNTRRKHSSSASVLGSVILEKLTLKGVKISN